MHQEVLPEESPYSTSPLTNAGSTSLLREPSTGQEIKPYMKNLELPNP